MAALSGDTGRRRLALVPQLMLDLAEGALDLDNLALGAGGALSVTPVLSTYPAVEFSPSKQSFQGT